VPPIVPGPNSDCIDDEFKNLPLDFEDSGVPLPTERRQSCYYESTIILKTFINKQTNMESELQQSFSNTKNFSFLFPEGKEPQEVLDVIQAKENQDILESDHIDGLEEFSFENSPDEELELKGQFGNFIEQMRLNDIKI